MADACAPRESSTQEEVFLVLPLKMSAKSGPPSISKPGPLKGQPCEVVPRRESTKRKPH